MITMRPEDPKHRQRVLKKLAKREYFLLGTEVLEDQYQYITGFERVEWTLLERLEDNTIRLCYIKTPYESRYGPQVLAKRRPNGRFWFISGAFADELDTDITDKMNQLANEGASGFVEFDVEKISPIYP